MAGANTGANTSGEGQIRGIDIDKLAKGFADEEIIFKRFVTNTNTSAREIRWYQKTAGVLDSADTSGITASQIANVPERSRPVVVEQSWTRQTSFVRKYFVESPTISDEDIKDSDIDILATNVRDLVRAIASQVDQRIYNILTENQTPSTILDTPALGNGWDDTTNGNPIGDILSGQALIRAQGYDISNLVLLVTPLDYKNLMNYLIDVKGSSIPAFSSEKVKSGVMVELLGARVVVSNNVVADDAVLFVPQRAATWKSFKEISSVIIDEPLIGKKIRVSEEGECLLTDPKAVCLITDTNT